MKETLTPLKKRSTPGKNATKTVELPKDFDWDAWGKERMASLLAHYGDRIAPDSTKIMDELREDRF